MGVRRVGLGPGKDVTNGLQELQACLEALGAERKGKWKVTVRLHHRKATAPGYRKQLLYMVRVSDRQNRIFLYLENQKDAPATDKGALSDGKSAGDEQSGRNVVVMNSGIEGGIVLQKLALYNLKLEAAMEGFVYALQDFEVKVGVCKLRSGVLKGIVVEVHYRPCVSVQEGGPLCKDLLAALGPRQQPLALLDESDLLSSFKTANLPEHYTSTHTAVQYVQLLNKVI